MSRAYSDPSRASDPYALPDVEVFYIGDERSVAEEYAGPGWYYWFCFPGCLPDSEPIGPFPTKQDALNDAQSQE